MPLGLLRPTVFSVSDYEAETRGLSPVSSIPEPSAGPLHTQSLLDTPIHTCANPTACREHRIPYVQIDMRLERVRSMSCKNTFPGSEQAWELHDTGDEPDVCVSELSIKLCIQRIPSSSVLPLFLFFLCFLHPEPKHSPLSHDDNGSIKGFFYDKLAGDQ